MQSRTFFLHAGTQDQWQVLVPRECSQVGRLVKRWRGVWWRCFTILSTREAFLLNMMLGVLSLPACFCVSVFVKPLVHLSNVPQWVVYMR
jgi:hypothetical protein